MHKGRLESHPSEDHVQEVSHMVPDEGVGDHKDHVEVLELVLRQPHLLVYSCLQNPLQIVTAL